MNISPVLLLFIEGLALYCLLAVACIANRMTRATRLHRRAIVVVLGVLAMWGLLRTLAADWPPTPASLAHLAALCLAAVYLILNPRMPT